MHRVFFSHIYPAFRDNLLFWIVEIFLSYPKILTKANYVNTLPVLRDTEIHSINNLWFRDNIADLVKSIENGLECLSLIMDCKTLDIFKKECFGLVTS